MLEELGNGVEGSAATSLKQNNAQKIGMLLVSGAILFICHF